MYLRIYKRNLKKIEKEKISFEKKKVLLKRQRNGWPILSQKSFMDIKPLKWFLLDKNAFVINK